jgi:hypothetical protein
VSSALAGSGKDEKGQNVRRLHFPASSSSSAAVAAAVVGDEWHDDHEGDDEEGCPAA